MKASYLDALDVARFADGRKRLPTLRREIERVVSAWLDNSDSRIPYDRNTARLSARKFRADRPTLRRILYHRLRTGREGRPTVGDTSALLLALLRSLKSQHVVNFNVVALEVWRRIGREDEPPNSLDDFRRYVRRERNAEATRQREQKRLDDKWRQLEGLSYEEARNRFRRSHR